MQIRTIINWSLPFIMHCAIAQETDKLFQQCVDLYQQSNFEQAYQQCLPLAEKNRHLAQFIVGNLLEQGLGTAQDHQKSEVWLKKSADLGNSAAQLKLAKLYCKGSSNSAINLPQAVEYFQKSAKNNVSEAQFMLALCYFKGMGVQQNYHEAFHWYNQAVSSGLNNGKKLENPIEARLVQSSDSAHEHYQIANNIQQDEEGLYLEGDLIWRVLAAEKNHPQAQYDLCQHYLSTAKSEKDLQMAFDWLHKAAKNQHQDAQLHLSWIHALGIHTKENLDLAIQWFHKASDPLKDMVQTENVELHANVKQAIQLLQRSADDQDIQNALAILDRGSKEGSSDAQCYLGKLYLKGKFLHQDKGLAAHLFEKAANQGHLEAQLNLAWMYLHGNGVQREYKQAYYWLNKASIMQAQEQHKHYRISLNL